MTTERHKMSTRRHTATETQKHDKEEETQELQIDTK